MLFVIITKHQVFEGLAKDVVAGENQTRVAIKTLHNNESTAKR